jgi:tRNA nucleotidyltransferase (CCA-adding enzyme)
MLHDLGKATTPAELLPRHIGHEQRGVELVTAFCRRLRVPNSWRDLALLVARYHTHCHRALELRAGTLLKMLEAIGSFRHPERLQEFLLACEADARGRKGLEHRPYPQANLIRQAHSAASAVTSRPLLAQGINGAALGEAIRNQRLARIREVIGTGLARVSHQNSTSSRQPNSSR